MADSERYDLFGNVGLDMTGWDTGMTKLLKDAGLLNTKWLAAGGAIAAVAAGLVECVRESANFESAMSNIETVVGKGNDSFLAQLANDVKSLSKTMPFSQTELAGTLYDIISYGVPAADAMDLLKTSAETAVGGFADVNDTFKLFGSIIKGYGLEWDDATEVADKMFFVAGRGASTISELASSIGGVVPFAKNLGVTLNEVYAVMSTLPGVTGTTSEAATQLTSVMVAMMDPAAKMKRAFNDLGVASGQELITKMGGLQGALMALEKYAKQHNMAIGEMLGRKEAQLAFFNLVGTQAGEYANNLKDVATATDLAQAAFAVKSADMTNQWKMLMNEIKLLMSGIGDAAVPLAKVLLEVGTGLTQTVGQIGQALGFVDKFITGWVVSYFDNAKNVINDWGDSIKGFLGIQPELNMQQQALINQLETETAATLKEMAALSGVTDATLAAELAKKDLNKTTEKNVELTKEQKKAQEETNKVFEDFRDDIADNIKRGWAEINSELFNTEIRITNVSGLAMELGDMKRDQFGFIDVVKTATEASGELRGKWDDMPEIIKEADSQIVKVDKNVKDNNPNWMEWAGYLRSAIGNIDGLSSSMKTLLGDIASVGAALLSGDFAGAIASASSQILNRVVIPAGEAIKEFFTYDVNLHEGEFRQNDTPTNYLEVYNQALKDGDEAMAEWALTMMGEFIPAAEAMAEVIDYRVDPAMEKMTAAIEKADDNKGRSIQTTEELNEELRQLAKEAKEAEIGSMGLSYSLNDVAAATNDFAEAVEKADDNKGRSIQTTEELNEELRQLTKEQKAAALGSMGIADATVYTTDKIKDQIYTVGKFELAWENMLKTTLDLWDEWEKDTRTIFTGLEKLLYFKVDVDTTTADEQIAASISEMMDYAESLNKTSDAYKDIQDNITEMLIQYAATGASASEAANGLALQIINIRNAIDEATDPDARDALQEQLDSMIEKFRTIEDVITKPWKLAVDTNDAAAKMQAFYDAFVPTKSDDPDKMHAGGFPRTAHSGYLASSEVDVRMLKNEMVLRPEATDKFGAQRLLDFNRSLDPSALGGQRPVKVVFHNATKQSWAEIVDDSIYPRMKEKERRFEVAGNPY